MHPNIIWTVEATITDRLALDAVMAEMVAAVSEEEGTTHYEWTLGNDETSLHVYERYRDADAARAHLQTWAKYADRFLAAASVTRFTVFCTLPPDLADAVAGLNPVVMTPLGGVTRVS